MKIGFVGLGMMGSHMCRNLIKGGHEALVRDVDAEREAALVAAGARKAASAAEIAREVEVLFTSLPMPHDVEKVLLGAEGAVEGAHEGLIIVDMSTNAPQTVQRIAAELAPHSVALIDAPVSGGVDGAEAATLAIMCGGDTEIFERVKPLLQCMGANVFRIGDIGAGNVAKLCNNMASFNNLVVACESLLLGAQAGVDPAVLAQVMAASSGDSFSLKRVERKGLTGNFEQEFSLNLAHKDLTLALELARQYGVPLTYGPCTFAAMEQARAKGWGGEDMVTLLRVVEEAMNTTVRGS